MPRAQPISLGERNFSSISAFKHHFRGILDEYCGDGLVIVNDEDHRRDLMLLLEKHCDYISKISTVDTARPYDFCVDRSPDFGTRCFHLYQDSEKRAHFSYISLNTRSPWSNFRNACRYLINDTYVNPRKERILRAQGIQNFGQYELVHHNPRFAECVREFIQHKELDLNSLQDYISSDSEGNNAPQFINEEIKQNFLHFYQNRYTDDSQFIVR